MPAFTLSEGDVFTVPASTAPRLIQSLKTGLTGYRGTLLNRGSSTVYYTLNPTAAQKADTTNALPSVVTDNTTERSRGGFIQSGEAIRIPQDALEFLCCCAGAATSVLMYLDDGEN